VSAGDDLEQVQPTGIQHLEACDCPDDRDDNGDDQRDYRERNDRDNESG
jgi:hypothetical protein